MQDLAGIPPSYGTRKCSECGADPPDGESFWERVTEVNGESCTLAMCHGCDEFSLTLCTRCGVKAEPGDLFRFLMNDSEEFMYTYDCEKTELSPDGKQTHVLCSGCIDIVTSDWPEGKHFPIKPGVDEATTKYWKEYGGGRYSSTSVPVVES